MFQKTDSPEFASGFLWQLVVLTVIVLSLVLFADKVVAPAHREMVQTPRIVMFPWVLAGGHTLENGLLAFSGKPAEAANGKTQVITLACLLLVSVVCPTIFLLHWRRRILAHPAKRESTPWTITHVLYGLCAALVLCISVAILPIAIRAEVVRNKLRDAQAVQFNRDAMVNELNFMAMDLSQYYILSKEYGGGNHSYVGYKLPEEASKTSEATYVVMPNGQEVAIRAESVRYPSCSIKVKVDSTGRLGSWIYGGKFR
jgi:hypothetical protein